LGFKDSPWRVAKDRPREKKEREIVTRPQVREKLIEIVWKELSVEDGVKITDATSFANDLHADSLDSVELVMKIEEEFGITIPEEEVAKLKTISMTIDYVFNALVKKRG
jgi:acyl carrier protein